MNICPKIIISFNTKYLRILFPVILISFCVLLIRPSYAQQKIRLTYIGTYPCGAEPKQVIFSPDSRYIYIPLMEDRGFQIFDNAKKTISTCETPEEIISQKYFVEGIFIKRNDASRFLVTQLTKAVILEYDVADPAKPVFLRAISTGGSWPKVIAYSHSLDCIAVSNWTSNSVAIIDYESGKVKTKLKKIPVPRGLAFTADGKYLLVAAFEGGTITKIDTSKWTSAGSIMKPNAAMRHIILSPDGQRCFVSNMHHAEIYEITLEPFKIIHVYKVWQNPNTIDLTRDGRYLFVSNRGPNNPKGYREKSLKKGTIMIFDTVTKELINTIPGGTQPTGLDISPDDKYLAFSNFQDNTIELFSIEGLSDGEK
jgi:DNA-binding beta-propeller fold protein YncE